MPAPRLTSADPASETEVDLIFDQAMRQDANFFLTSNYAVTGHAVSSVAALATDRARLTLTPGMYTGEALSATVDGSLQNAAGDVMDPAYLTIAFVGEGTAPTLSAVAAVGDTTVRATFNEPMADNAALRDVSNYVIAPGLGIPLTIVSVVPESAVNPTYVDLIVNEMTDGNTYTLSLDDAGGEITDAVGNAVNLLDAANSRSFTGSGTHPDVSSAAVVGTNRVRINFSEPMKRDAALSAPSNYLFTPITGGAAALYFDSVQVPPAPTNPTYVEIVTSEMTDGASYEVTVNGPTDRSLNPISATDTAGFTGVGENPTLARIVGVSKNRMDVVFSEPMRVNSDIEDPARYTWDNGLVTLDVLEVTADGTVKLVTSDQVPGVLYTLTIDPS